MERGLVSSREKARGLILAGQVLVNGACISKAGELCVNTDEVSLKSLPRYVSRGGDKLESFHKISSFEISGLIFMDVGSSTGGFSDYLLQHGALRVYAVDVGTNQLAYQLRQDERVVSLEKTHILKLESSAIPDLIQGFVCDLSFISLNLVVPHLRNFAIQDHFLVLLVKPQFEVQRDQVGKGGVVRDRDAIFKALLRVRVTLHQAGYGTERVEFSRIAGPKGNVEFFFLARPSVPDIVSEMDIFEKILEKENFFARKSDLATSD